MSTELVSAIDAAVAFVREQPLPMTEDEVARFDELAADVYRLAFAVDLVEAIPKQSELRSGLESTDPPMPPVQFESKLNLPGDWNVVSDYRYVFAFCDSARWYDDMKVLRSLASGTGKQPSKQKGTAGRKSSIERDTKIYNEYRSGLEDGKWDGTPTTYERCTQIDGRRMPATRSLGSVN